MRKFERLTRATKVVNPRAPLWPASPRHDEQQQSQRINQFVLLKPANLQPAAATPPSAAGPLDS